MPVSHSPIPDGTTYGQRSTRYTVGGQTVDINEADHALKHERQALLRVKYERNLDRLYLMDELTGSWSRQDAHHLLQGGSPLQMLSEHDEWYLSNKLIHTLRRKDNLYTLSSDIYVGGIPSAIPPSPPMTRRVRSGVSNSRVSRCGLITGMNSASRSRIDGLWRWDLGWHLMSIASTRHTPRWEESRSTI